MSTRGRTATAKSIPAPVGGWNSRDSLDLMEPTDAILLDNWFPRLSSCELRRGSRIHATGIGSGDVETLVEWASGGAQKFIACGTGHIYDATAFNTAGTSLASGFSVDAWQTINFRERLILVNGTDQPQQYNGTAVTAANYTGIADDSVLIAVSSYRSRLYFVEKNSLSVWYGAVDAITGALTEFDASSLFGRGSTLVYAGPWATTGDSSTTAYFALISNYGEVILYSGSNPADSSWTISGRYQIPTPLGYRAFHPFLSDLLVLTDEGLFPLSRVATQGLENSRINDKIASSMQERVRVNSEILGWAVVYYPRGQMLLCNVPSSSTSSEQHVQNTLTGAWCRFTGWNATVLSLFRGKLYYGDRFGRVCEADIGEDDIGQEIYYDVRTAFNYLDDRTSSKRFLMAKPLISSSLMVSLTVQVDVDFEDKSTLVETLIGTGGSEWDTAVWELSEWAPEGFVDDEWRSVSGIGECVSFRLRGRVRGLTMSLTTFRILYETGGLL